jgi:hypothetical protein
MRNTTLLCLVAIAFLSLNQSHAQDPKDKGLEAITKQAVQGQLEFLASDWTEGRATGQPGAYMAADYIASLFKVYGLQPAGDVEYIYPSRAERMQGKRPTRYRSFYQGFDLIEYKAGEKQEFALINKTADGTSALNFAFQTDFGIRPSDVAIELELPVVFVGYGFAHEESGYDDFKGVDVKGKIILCMSGYPGHTDTASIAYKTLNKEERINSWRIWRQKSRLASEHGAAAIIEVDPNTDFQKYWAANIPFRYNSGNYEGDKPRASYYDSRMKLPGEEIAGSPTRLNVSNRVLNELLKGSDLNCEEFAESVKNNMKPQSQPLEGKTVRIKTSVDSKSIRVRNVVGVIPGKDTSEIIVIGGHYDHLGKHDGWVWTGADDNASGTVGVMTMARAFMASGQQPEKTIVFAAWTGEEKGLLGSEYFADHPYNDAKMLLNLNYDMISRDDKDDTLGVVCTMNYTEKYGILKDVADKNNEAYGLGLDIKYRPSEQPGGGSDHSSFSQKDIPVVYFEAGFPPEYHQPEDHLNLINWDKLVKIIQIGYLNIWDLANEEWSE